MTESAKFSLLGTFMIGAGIGVVLWEHRARSGARSGISGSGAFGSRQLLPGGYGDKRRLSEFNPCQVAAGLKVEREHTPRMAIRREIVTDHLTEDPHYYSKLCSLWPDESGCKVLRRCQAKG